MRLEFRKVVRLNGQEPSPPPLTGGLEKKGVSLKVDWIEGTWKKHVNAFYPDHWKKESVEQYPFDGYTIGRKYQDGRIELSNPGRPEMGVHLVMSGSTLPNIENTPEESIKWLHENGFTFTRLDVAMDVYGQKLDVGHGITLVGEKRHITSARKYPIRTEVGGGLSLYIGTKNSQIYTRIYDKADEQNVKGDWKRIETVFQQKRAQRAAEAILKGVDYRSLIKGHIDFPDWRRWQAIMKIQPTKIKAEYQESKTREWLMKSCAPSLAREIYFDPEFLHKFLTVVALEKAELEAQNNIQLVS